MSWTSLRWMAAVAVVCAAMSATQSYAEDGELINDYPTIDRADYVFGCMQVNGNTRLALERCSCSIDVIAGVLPFEVYQHASTIKSLSQRGGESVAQFANPASNKIVHELKMAQIEGELRCF